MSLYSFAPELGTEFNDAISSLSQKGEELLVAQTAFFVQWFPHEHGRGVDWHPALQHLWIAVTSTHLKWGQFVEQPIQMSFREKTKWNGSIPAVCNRPVELQPLIASHTFHPISAVHSISQSDQVFHLPFAHDGGGQSWFWCHVLNQLTDAQVPKDLWLIKGSSFKAGSMPLGVMSFSVGQDYYEILSFDSFSGIEQAFRGALARTQHVEPAAAGGITDELTKLADLHDRGLLSAAEFQEAKAKILGT